MTCTTSPNIGTVTRRPWHGWWTHLIRGGRAAFLALAMAAAAGQVRINEIHYNPDVKTEPAEFIELVNTGTNAVALAGWRLADAVDFTFPAYTLPAGGYVVVAQNPAFLKSKFGADALGPFSGGLSKYGERIQLVDDAGTKVDEVDYGVNFPWPVVGDPPGYSIELVNPAADNDLGANWRPSVAGGAVSPQSRTLIPTGSTWRYVKGRQEASQPTTAWREPGFDDAAWSAGAAPIGYDPALAFGTRLDDMRTNYSTIFLRQAFTITNRAEITALTLRIQYDDGVKIWINGTNVLNLNAPAGELAFDGVAAGTRESLDFEEYVLPDPGAYLRDGSNLLAIQLVNTSLAGSTDCFLDLDLQSQTGPTGVGPTPGRANVAFVVNPPPAIRQVEHSPEQPGSGQVVRITAKVTDPDGVAAVTLHYQVVDPGAYIELTDAAYEATWTDLAMNDAGTAGDALANDGVYTVELPAAVQTNRRLVRYRISVVDKLGAHARAPFADDPQPNFAYFVYDGVPAWAGAVKPGDAGTLGKPFTVSAEAMRRVPAVHLLGKQATIEQSTWQSQYGGDAYPWLGTLVYDGQVYDHIHHRARGGVWRYAMVKNMWKFDFNRGHDFEPRDNWGRKLKTAWTKLNLGACIQQGDYNHRGEQGMFESVGFRLFQLAGVPATHTAFCQLRVVDAATETDPGSQFEGDFWGVYLMVEQEDGRFLEEHDLSDSNFYKMEGGTGELNNLGPLGPTDKSDLNAFLTVANGGAAATDAWWRQHLNLPAYLSYQTVVQAIHHYDICYDKNFFYHFSTNGAVTVTPWDLDLTWAENMYDAGCGGVDRIKSRLLPGAATYPAIWRAWQNRIREVRDLLWNEDEAWRLIDEYAGRLRGPTNAPTILDADRAQWDYNPRMQASGKAGQGRFYQWPNEPKVSKDFNGCVQLMKNYVSFRATNSAAQARALDLIAADAAIPATPIISYVGPSFYPVNALRFRASAYSGTSAFASMKWRIGEITKPAAPSWQASEPWKYEIEPLWESAELASFAAETGVPSGLLKPGRVYRARVRFTDAEGRASHWSAPLEFTAGEPDNLAELQQSLRLTEVMYNPPGGSALEFLELHNVSAEWPLHLDGAAFTAGITYTFPAGATLAPGAYLLVVKAAAAGDFAAFRTQYSLGAEVPIFGPYDGSLSDGGEQITLKAAAGGTELFSVTYGDRQGWPLAADGAGHSLVPRRDFGAAATGRLDFGGNWRASAFMGGSPGYADPEPQDGVVLNEIVSHTDFTTEYDSNDWIELFNRAPTNITLGAGWYLSDSATDLKKWQIPASTIIPARGFVSFDEVTGFHHPLTTGFGINKAGDQVFLSYLPGDARNRVVDAVDFAGQENDFAFARSPDGGAYWDYVTPRTRGAANAAYPERVVISEFLYHTGFATNLADPGVLEFIELQNAAPTPQALFNTNGVWRLGGGVDFDFPAGTTLAAGERVVVVPFAPGDAALLAVFRNAYALPATVRVFGPFTGSLANDTDRITLERPLAPDLPGDPVGTVIADEVIYFDQSPWPGGADGNGASYHRRAAGAPGSDPANWFAAAPTPGASAGAPVTDADQDAIPDDWERAHGLDPNDPSDAAADPDADGLTNLEEYRAGTDPWENSLRLVLASTPAGVELTFLVPAGLAGAVQYRDAVGSGDWITDGSTGWDAQASTGERTLRLTDTPGAARFYRVILW